MARATKHPTPDEVTAVMTTLHGLTLPEVEQLLIQLSKFDRTLTLNALVDILLDYRELAILTSTQ